MPDPKELIKKFDIELQLLNLAASTRKVYGSIITAFVYKHPDPANTSIDKIKEFILSKDATRTREQTKGAIAHFYNLVLKRPQYLKDIPSPKREQFIPVVMNPAEVFRVFDNIKNLKQRAIIETIYWCGLRISESTHIKVAHVDGKMRQLHIVQSKGAKDRIVPMPETLLALLRKYFKQYNPPRNGYLFLAQEGIGRDTAPYSERSVQVVFKRAAIGAGINKEVTVHSLRHSRATHLMDAGVPTKYIQEFLGHRDIKTTMIYSHTSAASSLNIFAAADKLIETQR